MEDAGVAGREPRRGRLSEASGWAPAFPACAPKLLARCLTDPIRGHGTYPNAARLGCSPCQPHVLETHTRPGALSPPYPSPMAAEVQICVAPHPCKWNLHLSFFFQLLSSTVQGCSPTDTSRHAGSRSTNQYAPPNLHPFQSTDGIVSMLSVCCLALLALCSTYWQKHTAHNQVNSLGKTTK